MPLSDLDLLRILPWLERAGKHPNDNFVQVITDAEYTELLDSPYVWTRSIGTQKFLRGLSDAGYKKIDELIRSYPRPTDTGVITVVREKDMTNNMITYQYMWGNKEIVGVAKELLADSFETHKFGGFMTIGPFSCRVVWEDQRTIYVVKDES